MWQIRTGLVVLLVLAISGCSNSTEKGSVHTAATPTAVATITLLNATFRPVRLTAPAQAQAIVSFHSQKAVGSDGDTFTIDDVTVDPNRSIVSIIDVVGLHSSALQYRTYSVREVAEAIRPILITSAGISQGSPSLPAPLGLVLSDGKTTNPLNRSSEFATGLLCVTPTGGVKIIHKQEYRNGMCTDAVQSGPIVVEPESRIGIYLSELKRPPLERSVIAIDRRGQLHFILTSPAHLLDLARVLVKSPHDGGIGCISALNIGTTSGLYFRDANAAHFLGYVDSPVAAAIAIKPKGT